MQSLEHRQLVSGEGKTKQEWTGLVCPVCRCVFRVPMNHHGAGVVCPECSYLLKIPRSGQRRPSGGIMPASSSGSVNASPAKRVPDEEVIPQIGADDSEAEAETPAPNKSPFSTVTPSDSTVQSKGNHGSGQASELTPKRKHYKRSPASGQVNALAWIVGGSLSGLAIVAISAWLFIAAVHKTKHPEYSEVSWPVAKSVTTLDEKGGQARGDRIKKPRENRAIEALEIGANVVDESRELVSKFLNAKTASDLEKLVRTPELTIPRLRAWYDQQKWAAPGLKDIAYEGRVKVKGTMAFMDVRLNDDTTKQITIEKTTDGYKVDWESWVAWSSMRWENLFERRPREPVEVRVYCKRGSYYNNVFNDDKKWFAVRLEYPDSYRSIYGYIDKKSSQFNEIKADLSKGNRFMATLRICYPENTVANNQVYITGLIQRGWVRASSVIEAN